eukprot:scaffold51154_cov58-Cyclotella_meneghiniana.AAC.4
MVVGVLFEKYFFILLLGSDFGLLFFILGFSYQIAESWRTLQLRFLSGKSKKHHDRAIIAVPEHRQDVVNDTAKDLHKLTIA